MNRFPRLGDVVPALEKTVSIAEMIAYAGATWDWHRIHYDHEFAAAKQLPGPIVDAQVYGAWFVQMLQDWLGPACFVQILEFSFRNLMFAGETLRCDGTVTAVSGDQVTVELMATIVGHDGTPDRLATASASAVVIVGRADGPAT